MAQQRLPMRKIRDVLRLSAAGLSKRQIAASLGIGPTAAGACLRRAREAGVGWPVPDDLDDAALERRLYPVPTTTAKDWRSLPDWPAIHRELRRKGVTLQLVWEEYRAAHPEGFAYTWFCTHFEAWKGRVRPTMRQTHVGGEKVFVDFAGDTIDVIDPATGEAHAMKLFVAALGASNFTYAEAVASEGLEDWICAHARMFAFLGGAPKAVVPDNLKSAVFKADRYDPGLNRTYAEMAAHYGTAILPARPYKPRDKAKVEVAVQVAQRWILARLRNRRFFSLPELNAAIRRLVDELNMRVMRGYGASRADLFATLDRPQLQPLPPQPYEFARWKRARVAPDYHVEMDSSWYSVPFGLIREEVDVRVCGGVVEIFHKGQRVASHPRGPGRRSHVTLPEHMPSAHRRHADWTPARVLAQAAKLGPSVAAFCERIMADRPHPEQGFRTCLGVLALARSYDANRLDAACRRGLTIRARSVASIKSILQSGLDQAFLDDPVESRPLQHANIRGQGYYH